MKGDAIVNGTEVNLILNKLDYKTLATQWIRRSKIKMMMSLYFLVVTIC